MRRTLASAKLDIEILRKATAYFAKGCGEVRKDRAHHDQYSVNRLCRVLAVSRSGYCQWRIPAPSVRVQATEALDVEVAAIYWASRDSYGRPRVVRQLRAQGRPVSAERVRRSLQRQGLPPVYRRPYRVTTDSTHRLPVAPNLLDRRFDGWQPNQAWVSDITFVARNEDSVFLTAILDLVSRRIVRWSMSGRIADPVCASTAQCILATQTRARITAAFG